MCEMENMTSGNAQRIILSEVISSRSTISKLFPISRIWDEIDLKGAACREIVNVRIIPVCPVYNETSGNNLASAKVEPISVTIHHERITVIGWLYTMLATVAHRS